MASLANWDGCGRQTAEYRYGDPDGTTKPIASWPPDHLLGRSPAISALREEIRHLATFDTIGSPHAPTVLLQGETGTGKGLVARVIHDSGPRAQGPFIDVNCAAIPETLLEAEIFGFEAGTFTDAKRAKPGLLEAASGGTLFLDEVEALPLALQSKFLKAIEEKWVRRLGAVRGQSVDVKIIAATTADLGGYAAEGRFRLDLYHRLAVVVVTLPSLRARADDILLMAEHFLRRYAEAHGVRPNRLSRAAEAWLRRYGLQSPRERAPSPVSLGDHPTTRVPAKRGAERARERPTAPSPAWEHKPVAVLAIELTFPTTAAAYEPWTAASRWEQALVAKVQGFGGVVLQRSPALLLVAFGIPQTLEQLPHRAVQAALALRHLVAEGADQGPCPALRLVVHWGEVLVDVQASDPTAQLRALGETLAWPVRLLGQTAPGEILLSPKMGPLVEGWCEVQAHQVPLQGGQPGPIGVRAVVGNRPPWARRQHQGWRPRSPFVGRDQELATLRERLRQVEGGRGQVVAVMGDPGTGKSRLCDEFVRSALAQPWLTLQTQGTAYGQATPYLPVLELLKGYFHIDDREDRSTIRDKVSTHLHSLDDTLTSTVPAFLTLLGVPVEDPQWQALEAAQRRQPTLDALRWVLVRESQVQPVLLVCEDLHWIDTETQAFLDTLVDSLSTAQLLLLVNYRPEYRHSWGHKTAYTQLRLDPLPPASADELLHLLLGDDPSLAPLTTLLIERTDGNPFFLEESVQTLVETQGLVGERGAYRLTQALPSLQVPATVQAVLAARIDRLPPEAKRLLQTAAVIGHEIPFPLLHPLAELSEDALHRGLAHLQGAEFLYETRLFPDRVYTFKHALTQQVAYSCLVQDRRRALHARIAAALEALAGDQMATQVDRLAHHALRGEVWDTAVTYCQQAGARAHDRAAFREAVAAFEQALQALAHLPEYGDTRVRAIDLRLALRTSLAPLGEYGRCLALLGEAEALARALDDRARLGRVLAATTNVRGITGDHDGAMAAGQQALELAAELGNSALRGRAFYFLGQTYFAIGDFGRAAELQRWSVEAADREAGTPNTDVRIGSRARLARTLGTLGAFAEGRRHGEEALRLATLSGRGQTPIIAHGCLGHLYLAQGDLEHAIRVLDQGLALCRASGNRDHLRAIAAGLGYASALQGRLAEGRALLEEAINESLRTGALQGLASRVSWLSEVWRLAGRGEEAWQYARQALDLARQHQERANEAYALHQRGAVQAHADPADVVQAEAHYQEALALAEALGMRPLQAHCYLELGRLYGQIGRREEARVALPAAIALYRSMDMTFWLPQAEAALGQISGSAFPGKGLQ